MIEVSAGNKGRNPTVAKKSASDLVERMGSMAEEIEQLAVAETRRNVADLLKEVVRDYKGRTRDMEFFEDEVRQLLKIDTDDEDWEISPDLLNGILIAAQIAGDARYEF